MTNITEALKRLEMLDWTINKIENPTLNKQIWYLSNPPKYNACYRFDKTFVKLEGVGVTISIHLDDGIYKVYCSAEHRTSGPAENFIQSFTSKEDALQKAIETCYFWEKEE